MSLAPRVADWKARGQLLELSGWRLFHRDAVGGSAILGAETMPSEGEIHLFCSLIAVKAGACVIHRLIN
jgi:hypothetical protein